MILFSQSFSDYFFDYIIEFKSCVLLFSSISSTGPYFNVKTNTLYLVMVWFKFSMYFSVPFPFLNILLNCIEEINICTELELYVICMYVVNCL